MKIGPKYKIARRLGAPVFEKTQTQKFTLSQTKKSSTKAKGKKRPSQPTGYGLQMTEKQKTRYAYLLSNKQLSRYVKKVLSEKTTNKVGALLRILESRLDNTVFRTGLASTRSAARQLVSHGHINVNGKRVTSPSFQVKVGDKISIRPRSFDKGIFNDLEERVKEVEIPTWLKFDVTKKETEVKSKPDTEKIETLFDLKTVLEFYSR
jgi:small subunit ribosomal protein S4